jgi:hypothetical protein
LAKYDEYPRDGCRKTHQSIPPLRQPGDSAVLRPNAVYCDFMNKRAQGVGMERAANKAGGIWVAKGAKYKLYKVRIKE